MSNGKRNVIMVNTDHFVCQSGVETAANYVLLTLTHSEAETRGCPTTKIPPAKNYKRVIGNRF